MKHIFSQSFPIVVIITIFYCSSCKQKNSKRDPSEEKHQTTSVTKIDTTNIKETIIANYNGQSPMAGGTTYKVDSITVGNISIIDDTLITVSSTAFGRKLSSYPNAKWESFENEKRHWELIKNRSNNPIEPTWKSVTEIEK